MYLGTGGLRYDLTPFQRADQLCGGPRDGPEDFVVRSNLAITTGRTDPRRHRRPQSLSARPVIPALRHILAQQIGSFMWSDTDRAFAANISVVDNSSALLL